MAEVNHTDAYFATSDIDWFFRLNDINIHVASMGRKIPTAVVDSLPTIYRQISAIEMVEWSGAEGVWYNEEILRTWLRLEDNREIARYLATFVVMARKGFYSFAPITFDSSDENYFLMAKPVNYVDRAIDGFVHKTIPEFNAERIGAYTPVRLVDYING